MKVQSQGKPSKFVMRLVKVFKLGDDPAQKKTAIQFTMPGGCLLSGNYALRCRGGCCICLLMASGITAKRCCIWLADAEEGELIYTTFSSKRFKLAVFIILPRLVYTPHPCDSQIKMDGSSRPSLRGDPENTKDILIKFVRHLSRLYAGKTNGQEKLWADRPPNWPKELSWKNPTSLPKDDIKMLHEKYNYLRSFVSEEKYSDEYKRAFKFFEKGDKDTAHYFLDCISVRESIQKMKKRLNSSGRSKDILANFLQEELSSLNQTEASSLHSSLASTSRNSITSNMSSASTSSRKRKRQNRQSNTSKTEELHSSNCFQNKRKYILSKPTETESHTVSIDSNSRVMPLSSVEEHQVNNIPFIALLLCQTSRNTVPIDSSSCTMDSYSETLPAYSNSQPTIKANPVTITNFSPNNTNEYVSRSTSVGSSCGNLLQESNTAKETGDNLYGENFAFYDNDQGILSHAINDTTEDINSRFDPSELFDFEGHNKSAFGMQLDILLNKEPT